MGVPFGDFNLNLHTIWNECKQPRARLSAEEFASQILIRSENETKILGEKCSGRSYSSEW